MIIAYSYIPVAEEIIADRLRTYFMETLKWKSLYPTFAQLRVSNEFPWVQYMNENLDTGDYPDLSSRKDLFPSITVVNTQDMKSPTVFKDYQTQELSSDEFEDFKTLASETGSVIAPDALTAMETYFENNDTLYGYNIRYQKQDVINIDITVDDYTDIKNRIYDLVTMFLVGSESDSLENDLEMGILRETINGNRSGTYNVEFGMVLRGATIQFKVDYVISQVYYNTDVGTISDIEIEHNVN